MKNTFFRLFCFTWVGCFHILFTPHEAQASALRKGLALDSTMNSGTRASEKARVQLFRHGEEVALSAKPSLGGPKKAVFATDLDETLTPSDFSQQISDELRQMDGFGHQQIDAIKSILQKDANNNYRKNVFRPEMTHIAQKGPWEDILIISAGDPEYVELMAKHLSSKLPEKSIYCVGGCNSERKLDVFKELVQEESKTVYIGNAPGDFNVAYGPKAYDHRAFVILEGGSASQTRVDAKAFELRKEASWVTDESDLIPEGALEKLVQGISDHLGPDPIPQLSEFPKVASTSLVTSRSTPSRRVRRPPASKRQLSLADLALQLELSEFPPLSKAEAKLLVGSSGRVSKFRNGAAENFNAEMKIPGPVVVTGMAELFKRPSPLRHIAEHLPNNSSILFLSDESPERVRKFASRLSQELPEKSIYCMGGCDETHSRLGVLQQYLDKDTVSVYIGGSELDGDAVYRLSHPNHLGVIFSKDWKFIGKAKTSKAQVMGEGRGKKTWFWERDHVREAVQATDEWAMANYEIISPERPAVLTHLVEAHLNHHGLKTTIPPYKPD